MNNVNKEKAKDFQLEQIKINANIKGEKIKIIMDRNKKTASINKRCRNSRDDNLSQYNYYVNKKK